MKTRFLLYILTALIAMTGGLYAVESDLEGAIPGKWTMDLDAAKQVAAEKQLPILLDFSGSDWCSWCMLMETNVFTKTEWKAYATNSIIMVLLDYPNDKSLVPEKYTQRNTALAEQYNIEGFPTFVILDSDGITELGRLGAGTDKTPDSFIAEIRQVLRNSATEKEKFIATLSPEQKAAYDDLSGQMDRAKEMLENQIKEIETANAKAVELQKSLIELESRMNEFRMEQELSAEDFQIFKKLNDQYNASIKKLQEWVATNPDNTDENIKLYEEMVSEIQAIEERLSGY